MKLSEPTNETLAKIADESGLAVVVVDENGAATKFNNNSICENLYSSAEFAPRCAEFCGRAFQMAADAGEAVSYQCYAGLDCRAVPLNDDKTLVAIVGRTFTKAENYRRAATRAVAGDWNVFPPSRFFENVLINGSSKNLEATAKRLEGLVIDEAEKRQSDRATKQLSDEATKSEEKTKDDLTKLIEEFHQQPKPTGEIVTETVLRSEDAEETAAWRSLFGSLFSLSYTDARSSIMDFLAKRYALRSTAWLERRENHFESVLATGMLEKREFKINLPANDKLLFDALGKELALDLRERAQKSGKQKMQTTSLFPVSIGGEVQSALLVADELTDEDTKRRISRFCKTVAAELEILRLREEVKRRSRFAETVEKFNARLKNIDAEDFWANLTRFSAELMQSERSSLLVFDEKNDSLTVKAAIGATAELITNKTEEIGERIARVVLQNGNPVAVADISKVGLPTAPSDWKYKTNSFISYPFVIGERRIGVLNIADKTDGAAYGEADLEILRTLAPQFAVLIDRAGLKNKAGEFEQLSVTDALTGLLNRRYLEERLSEEIKRSNRYGYAMSFMMLDVDNFKSYNDNFGHLEGDKALKLVAQNLRETLRGADIAARYGGEEFSILLPQTTVTEAAVIAERLRENIESAEFPNRRVTISVGIAGCCLELNSAHELIAAADRALYEAKRSGRNNVQIYENLKKNYAAEVTKQGEKFN